MTRLAGVFFALLFLAYGFLANDIQLDFWAVEETFNARSFPFMIAIGGCFFSILLAIAPAADQSLDVSLKNPAALLLVILMLAYSFSLEPLGFPLATTGFLAGALIILGEHRWLMVGSVSLGLTLTIWLTMTALGIYLEPGVLDISAW